LEFFVRVAHHFLKSQVRSEEMAVCGGQDDFVVSYIAIAVVPRTIRYFGDRETNPTDDDL